MKIISWNVNGIRSAQKKGFLNWFSKESPDILCIQETKAHEEQLQRELIDVEGYHAYFSSPQRKGYSGVAIYSKIEPLSIERGFDVRKMDYEGRVLMAKYDGFRLINAYFPNGKMSGERLEYKLEFYDAFLEACSRLIGEGVSIIACGDVNTAHREIDIARPKENEKVSGFLPEERAYLDRFIDGGLIDTFRLFNKDAGHYSWWDYKTRARERNVGWRIDYFYVSRGLRERVGASYMLSDVMGSDHCPIVLELSL